MSLENKQMQMQMQMQMENPDEMQALSDMLEKLQQSASGVSTLAGNPLRSSEETLAYLTAEIQTLKAKQKTIQESLQNKGKELQVMRETLLVVSGALQGLQHVLGYIEHKESLPVPAGVSDKDD